MLFGIYRLWESGYLPGASIIVSWAGFSFGLEKSRHGLFFYRINALLTHTMTTGATLWLVFLRSRYPLGLRGKHEDVDDGYWEQLEIYLKNHSEVEFSHVICPDCAKKAISGSFIQ
jgi:hypothetical protein